MSEGMIASIVFTDLGQDFVAEMTSALKDAGFIEVREVGKVESLIQVFDGDNPKYRLPEELAGSRFIIFDEFVGGRSAFELHTMLKAAEESKEIAYGVLMQSPPDTTVFAAWVAGFDLCLRKDTFNAEEFGRFCNRIHSGLKLEDAGVTEPPQTGTK